ncbi:uncharacterized protein LOC136758196 [Amia ocellicauda]|uniref:uncharacterized protein LOC136758196 n=1 Tax=Amia ocellicauda TaxID=2972642 RepID=UPI0034643874
MATRISSCCEYRYTIGLQQGRHSCFRLANLNGGQPCYRSSIRQDRPPLMQHRRLPHKVINASTDSEGLQTSVKTVNSLRPKRGSPPQTGDLLSSEETIDTVGEDERASRKVGTLGSLMRPSQPCEAMREVNSSVPSMAKPKAYQKKTRHLRSRNKKDSENRIKMKEAENEGETPPKDPLLDRTSPEKKDEKITGPNVHSRTGNTNGEQDAAEIRASKERVGIVSLPDKVQYKQHSLSKDREQRRRLVEKLSSVFQRSNSCTSDVELSDSSDTSEHTASTLSLRGTKGLRKNLACQPVNGDEEILSSKCRQDYSTKIYSKDGSIEGTTSKQGDNRSAPTCSGVSVHLGTDGSEELSDNPNQLKRNPQALLGNGDIKAESGHSHADQDQASLITEPPQRVCETASNQVCLGQPPVKHNLHLQHKQLGQGEDNSRHTSPQNTVDNIAEEPEPESSSPLNTDDEEVIKLLVSREVQEKAQYLRRQVADMVAVLEACDLVEQLVLRNTGLNDELLGCLVTALMNSPSEVKMINLNLNSIGPQGAQCLLDLLKIKPQVRGLL